MECLREEKIALTVCPLSNVKLRVFDAMEQHNLKQLLDLDLRVTINSDDPSYFGGYITRTFWPPSAPLAWREKTSTDWFGTRSRPRSQ